MTVIFVAMATLFLSACGNSELDGAQAMNKVTMYDSEWHVVAYTYRYTGHEFKARDKVVLKITNDGNEDITYFSILRNVTHYPEDNSYNGTHVQGFWDGDLGSIYREDNGEPYTSSEDIFEMCVENNGFYFKYWAQLYNGKQEKLSDYRGGTGDVYNDDGDLVIKPGETYYFVFHFAVDMQIDFIFG